MTWTGKRIFDNFLSDHVHYAVRRLGRYHVIHKTLYDNVTTIKTIARRSCSPHGQFVISRLFDVWCNVGGIELSWPECALCVVCDFYIRKVNELMDFLLLLSNGEMGEMGNILYDVEIDDQLGRTWQSWISSGYLSGFLINCRNFSLFVD